MSDNIKRFEVKREGIVYGYVEEGALETRRWNFVYPIVDGKISMDITTVNIQKQDGKTLLESQVKNIGFDVDFEKRTFTRNDGTVFDLVEVDS
ncbi:hypothetical protein [Enterobacter sp.]|uniref:hypothetical protein n=1 Tax=Enterobacter sp. TaxID=42895 RepID=UPI00296F1FE6|nr:hypothetical protein [Enterobacter sp.]